MDQSVSVARTLASAFRFLGGNLGSILRLAVLPLLLGWVTLYVSLYAYLDELSVFLHSPNARIGSQALGLVAAGFFITLLFHCVLAVGLTELALGRLRPNKVSFRVGHTEWRLYAAYLRVLLLVAGAIGVPLVVAWGAARLFKAEGNASYGPAILVAGYVAIVIALIFVAVRVRFLMAPVVVMEQGPVLRRALSLSRGLSLRLLVILIVCIVPGSLVQSAAETAARHAGVLPAVNPGASFRTLVDTLRQILPEFVTISMASYFVTLILLVGAAVAVYRTRTGASSAAG